MKLQFKTEFMSITEFEPIQLTDFSILTGLNGSGKTHLLLALKDGHSQIDSIDLKDIVFFDFVKFKIDNEGEFYKDQITQEREAAWNLFIDIENRNIPDIKNNLEKIKNNHLPETDCKKIKDIVQLKGKFLFNLDDSDFESNDELKNKLVDYKNATQDFFSQENLKGNQQAQSIHALSKKLDFFIDEISESKFMNLYIPTTLKENFLPTQLCKIFLDYRVKEYEEYHKNLESANHSSDHDQLKTQAQQKCKNLYGGSPPWEIINDFLHAYSNFRYSISYPKEFTTETYFYKTRTSFTPVLTDNEKDLSINYQNLSSGEQVLFALALCLFKGKSDNVFPKLLLLDEIDATLHPSMIGNLLHVIQEVLLKKGTKVILATHSPTTIALAPEEIIFVVNKEGKNRIEKRDKKETLGILTEGYMTIEEGIQLFDQVSKKEISIITEGNNTKYIEKAIALFANDKKDRIDVIPGVEGSSGDKQLRTLFNFFTKVNHKNKVVFVWDWDYMNSLEMENNTFPCNLPKNDSNNLAPKGIENMFDEDLFEDFITVKKSSQGHETRMFDGTRKVDFMNHMTSIANPENFKNFKPLIEFIESIMKSQ